MVYFTQGGTGKQMWLLLGREAMFGKKNSLKYISSQATYILSQPSFPILLIQNLYHFPHLILSITNCNKEMLNITKCMKEMLNITNCIKEMLYTANCME